MLRATEEARFYALQLSEFQMLLVVLGSFPLRSRSHVISKSGDSDSIAEAQKLLDDAMRERRSNARRELRAWLQTPDRFRSVDDTLEWRVENDRREWLLQILNEVRLGAWAELGSPDDLDAAHRVEDEKSIRHLVLMDMAGAFQTQLLLGNEPA